jgi:hypothetical protein
MDLSKRVGQFSITTFGGAIFDDEKQREVLRMIMQSVVVITATRFTGVLDQITYVALCEDFDAINVGEKIPVYDAIFTVNEKEEIQMIWRKQNEIHC